ncbi:MAG: outer membrane protein assembly factor BamD [Pseudomonadota bacterium]|nr:outer membrane protein assembly factor BamD [Pseudomonadota bacterium]
MRSTSFIVFAILLLVGNLELFRYFQFYFSGTDHLKFQVKTLRKKIQNQELKAALIRYQFDEFKQEVAAQMPFVANKMKSVEEGYPLRNIASLAVAPTFEKNFLMVSGLFEKGKKSFREGKFVNSNKIFLGLIEKYPESIHVVESYFFLIEGKYQNKELEDCVVFIDSLMSKYPESELTGWSLLRLGKIFEIQERFEDSVDVYNTIIGTYQDKELKKQAGTQLSNIKL